MSEIPLAFRAEILGPLTDKLRDGYSSSLVGVGDSGKSEVVRHLKREDVRRHYFGEQDAARVLYVYIDLDSLQSYTDHAAYAKLLQALVEDLPALEADTHELQATLESQWHEFVTTPSPSEILAQTYLARALKHVLDEYADRVIYVLDDCDALIQEVPGTWLRGLRALRNDHPEQLMYVTVSRKELSQLRPTSPEFETFFELFSPHLIFVGPNTETDARGMIERLDAHKNGAPHQLTAEETHRILELSGGHAGLIGVVYQATNRPHDPQAIDLMSSDIIELLSAQNIVRAECDKILESLTPVELSSLQELASGANSDGSAIPVLKRKGLVKENLDGQRTIFSPLLREAAKHATHPASASDSEAPHSHLRVDPENRTVISSSGKAQVTLSVPEFELFVTLFQKMPEPGTEIDLVNHLMAVEPGGDPEQRVQDHVAALNERLQTLGLKIQTSADGYYLLRAAD
jgi:hypothetical protein